MALGGALFELESIVSVPAPAQTGRRDMEWWGNEPGVPHAAEFDAGIKKMFNPARRERAAPVRRRRDQHVPPRR